MFYPILYTVPVSGWNGTELVAPAPAGAHGTAAELTKTGTSRSPWAQERQTYSACVHGTSLPFPRTLRCSNTVALCICFELEQDSMRVKILPMKEKILDIWMNQLKEFLQKQDWHFNERNKIAFMGMLPDNTIKRLEQGKEIHLYSHPIVVIFGQTQSLKLKYTS